jgi:hypothetical protein
MFKFIDTIGHTDIVKGFNQDMSNFQTQINEANKLMESIRSDQNYNAEVLKKINEITNNPQAVQEIQKVIENNATVPIQQVPNLELSKVLPGTNQSQSWWENFLHRGQVGNDGITGNGVDGGIESIKNSLTSISKFTDSINWIIANPYETFKIVMLGLCDVVQLLALVVCAASIIMAILGHKEGLKYIPISLTIYTLLKILVVIL